MEEYHARPCWMPRKNTRLLLLLVCIAHKDTSPPSAVGGPDQPKATPFSTGHKGSTVTQSLGAMQTTCPVVEPLGVERLLGCIHAAFISVSELHGDLEDFALQIGINTWGFL